SNFPNERYAESAEAIADVLRVQVTALDGLKKKLGAPLGRQTKGYPQPFQAEAWRSDATLDSLDAAIAGAQQLWQGQPDKGLKHLVPDDQAELASRIEAAYATTRQHLAGLDQPFSVLLADEAGRQHLDTLYRNIDTLHRLHQNELAKALGVQIAFNAHDGDRVNRRVFLGLSGAFVAASAIGGWALSSHGEQPLLLSARNAADGRHYAVGYRLDGSCVFATLVNVRCHDVHAHPYLPLAVFVGRRPSRESYLIDTRNGSLLQVLATPDDRHFYGHGVFHASGDWFYTTENDTRDAGRGVLGIYRFEEQRLVRTGEHPTHGIGPHQLLWMPDGETLVIANGGIRTEADSREMMNLDAME